MMLSAALIAKNEERFLGGCLESLRGVADDVVVVDTGSDDNTREIAREHGARLFDFPWTGDFAAARNHALEQSQGDWILYIDADERVRPPAPDHLPAIFADTSMVAYFVHFHSAVGLTAYREVRLFRNHPRIRFEGNMHETIWPGIQSCQLWHGGEVGYSDLVLDHLGYEGDQTHKHERNLPLLLEALKRDPGKIYHRCHLAQVYAGLGRHAESRAAWEEAVRRARGKSTRNPADAFAFLGLIESNMESGEDVGGLIEEARRLFPENIQFDWLEAHYLLKQERYEQAAVLFQKLLRHGQDQDFEPVAGYDERLFGDLSWSGLALCHFRLERYAEAADCYRRAKEHNPQQLEYRVKESLCEKLAAQRPA